MADNRIESRGFAIGRWWIPPFSAGRGECVVLHLPAESDADRDGILACLRGAEPVANLVVPARVAVAGMALGPVGWRRWLLDPTPFDWLRKETNVSADSIHEILRDLRIEPQMPLSRLAGTPRMLLGLAAALAGKPDMLVFSTAGLDPCGVRQVENFVAAHLPEFIGIYLARPYYCQGQLHNPNFFPVGQVATVTAKPESLAEAR